MFGGIVQKRSRYIPPRTVAYELGNEVLPFELRDAAHMLEQKVSAPPGTRVQHQYTTLVNSNREFVEVSDSFCKLLGYKRHQLIGLKYDDVTAPTTNDIPTIFCLFARQGYMHGLWMLRSHDGDNILVRYESWIRSDHYIQGVMELVG